MSEEIIIDGVNVAGCIYYNAEKIANCGMFALGDFKCEGQICLYKQLKRLQAENEQLKEQLSGKTFFFENCEKFARENEQLKEEIKTYDKAQYEEFKRAEEYKKALEEIREYLQQFKKKKSRFYTLNDVVTDIANNIEKIINEVLK